MGSPLHRMAPAATLGLAMNCSGRQVDAAFQTYSKTQALTCLCMVTTVFLVLEFTNAKEFQQKKKGNCFEMDVCVLHATTHEASTPLPEIGELRNLYYTLVLAS